MSDTPPRTVRVRILEADVPIPVETTIQRVVRDE